jgi:D-tyrosyl-tRNA(Tyr) deacylase
MRMMSNRKAVYFLCADPKKDEVAPLVFEKSKSVLSLAETDMIVDGYPVLKYEQANGNTLYYVRTNVVVCEDYKRYIPILNDYFNGCDLAVMVNWHGGQNAPDKVICIHTVGDVATANYSSSNPELSTNLARALEKNRQMLELNDFRVTTEATHWSGIVYGGDADWIKEYKVPFLDVEIGSTSESYNNPIAVEVISRALTEVFDEPKKYPTVLYIGGIHFEDTITNAVLHPTHPVSLTHILPSRWIENEMYTGEIGVANLMNCVNSIAGGIDGIVIHEKLKKEQKDVVTALSNSLGIEVIKRKALKSPESTMLYTINQ